MKASEARTITNKKVDELVEETYKEIIRDIGVKSSLGDCTLQRRINNEEVVQQIKDMLEEQNYRVIIDKDGFGLIISW